MAGSLGAYIALMRPKNLVLAGATVPLGAYFALMDAGEPFPTLAVALHTLAVVLFTGAGNAMNDIKDAEIDKTAHPMRPIPSGQLTIQQASRFTSVLWAHRLSSAVSKSKVSPTTSDMCSPGLLPT